MNKPVYYKDLLTGHRKYKEEDLGRKGLSLSLLVQNDVPVPPFFIIRPDIFSSVISTIFHDTNISSLEEFRRKVKAAPLSPQSIQSLETFYSKISGFGQAWVAMRSSIVAPTHPDSHFSGIMHSLLNVRGVKDLEDSIKTIYASLFEDKAYDYLQKKKISYGDVKSAVIIQKMIQAEVSGIMYTYDPITLNNDHVSIEAVFGLGDVLADGSLNPDVYICDKKSLDIVEKKIVPQDWMKVRKVGDTDSLEHLQRVPISKVWQYSQKLDDALIRELTQLAERVEKALGGPHIIEWAMERGNLYILQAKPVKSSSNTSKVDDIKHKVSTMSDIDSFSKIADDTKIEINKKVKQKRKKIELPTETLLFSGAGASSGVAYGEVIVVPTSANVTPVSMNELLNTVTKRHILVTDEFTSQLEQLFLQAGGVVTNFGGINSDAAMTAREIDLPAVVGSRIATSFLQNGFLVKIDGGSGAVYGVDFLPKDMPKLEKRKSFKKEDIQVLSKKEEKKTKPKTDEGKARDIKELPVKVFLTNAPFGNSSFIHSLKVSNGTYSNSKDIMLPVTSAKKVEISRIKRIKKETTANIYILIKDSKSVDSILEIKKKLSTNGIRRSPKLKLIVAIHSIFGLLNTTAIIEQGLDGILYDIPALSKSYAPSAKKLDDKFWQLFTDNLENIKNSKVPFIGLSLPEEYFTIPLESDLKPLIKNGISSLVYQAQMDHVTEDDLNDALEEMMKIQLG